MAVMTATTTAMVAEDGTGAMRLRAFGREPEHGHVPPFRPLLGGVSNANGRERKNGGSSRAEI